MLNLRVLATSFYRPAKVLVDSSWKSVVVESAEQTIAGRRLCPVASVATIGHASTSPTAGFRLQPDYQNFRLQAFGSFASQLALWKTTPCPRRPVMWGADRARHLREHFRRLQATSRSGTLLTWNASKHTHTNVLRCTHFAGIFSSLCHDSLTFIASSSSSPL